MVNKKSWGEFRETGLLLIINQILHIFGWAIVVEMENDKVTGVYPARVKFRGFGEASVDKAYKKVSAYMKENASVLYDEAQLEDKEMKKQKFTDFYDAWWWLYYHPLFIDYEAVFRDKRFLDEHAWIGEDICEFYSRMQDYIEVSPHKVNPKTRSIDDDESLNTHVEVWIETGYKWREKIPFDEKDHWCFYHDINLDCGGDTYEEAIVTLANLVWKHYKDGKKFMNGKLKTLGIKVK